MGLFVTTSSLVFFFFFLIFEQTCSKMKRQVYDAGKRTWTTTGKEQERAKKDLIDNFKMLENELGDQTYFGSETFGVSGCMLLFLLTIVTIVGFTPMRNLVTSVLKLSAPRPKLIAWAKRCFQRESVSKSLADFKRVYDIVYDIKQRYIWMVKWKI